METFGERMRAKNIGVLSGGRSKDKVIHGYDENGDRTKTTIDQLGNEVTEHDNKKNQVDVKIKAPQVQLISQEVRDA